jgi:RND family efflux transporter MFP subunit
LAVEAITKPSGDVKLAFVHPGLIGRVLVKEGQTVEAGQVLMEQDDKVEQVQLEQLEAQAEDLTKVDYARAQLDQKKVYLKRITEVDPNATTPTEVEMAQLDVKVAELSLQLAQFTHTQEERKYREFQAQIERMRLRSPIPGKVEQVSLKEGEAADALAPILRVVSIDPLWIDAPVELSQARGLAVGASAQVEFPPSAPAGGVSSGPAVSIDGKIIHIGAVAEAASNTLLVRVEAANPSARPAGERVEVTFSPANQGKGARPVQGAATQPHSPSDDKKE